MVAQEWTDTLLAAHPGFEPHWLYPECEWQFSGDWHAARGPNQ